MKYIRQFNKDLWVLSFGWFVSALGFGISIPFISIYFHSELGLTITQIGLFFGFMAVVRSFFQAIGGEMSDHVERRHILIFSQLFRAVAFILLAISIYQQWGFLAISIFLLINSIFGAVFQPTANALVSDLLPPAKRLDGYALTRSAGNLGWAAGPAIGGFLAGYNYGLLFVISSAITFLSCLVFWMFLKIPQTNIPPDKFKFRDLFAIKNDPYLARHCFLTFLLYLVVSQLIAPFSVYAVEMVRISEYQLGLLYTLNGITVAALQMPVTGLLSKYKLSIQLALGAFLYAIGYGMMGFGSKFEHFVGIIMIVTLGEILMSPPALALTSRLAPAGRMGRYMGIYGFFITSGWSLGPLYGGLILDHFSYHHPLAWISISSLAVVSGIGYLLFSKKLPDRFNR
ncbi:MAG: MFS transporter [Desulfobacterales bacterium]|nr:MFS transporter [Desulfobacterales bacterium]